MTALNEPQLQKSEPGNGTQESGLLLPAAGISETSWQIIIFTISMVVILLSVYCLSHGITIIFMHLYYLPIVLLSYRYRYRGFVLSVIIGLIYICLVLFYFLGQNEVILEALFRLVVFIGIAAVVAYLSEQFHQSAKSLKKVSDIQESSLMNANVWLMLLDRRGSVLLWNNAAERISGYSAAEVTGSNNIWKLLYPDKDYRAAITKKIERIIAEDSFFENLETTIRTRSGEEKVISWNTRSFPVTSGQDARSIAIGIDITERKRVEDALQFTRHSVDSATETLVTIAKDGHFADVNDAFCRKSGYSRDELLTMTVHDIDPDYNAEIWSAFWNKLKQSGSLTIETTHRTKEGKTYPVETTLTYFEYNGNEYHCGFARDITERKRAEEALHLFKDLVEHSSDAIGMSTPEGKHYYQNEAFDRLFGEIGDSPPDTVYVDKAIGKQVFDTIIDGGSWQGEVKMFRTDRTILEIFGRAYAIQNPDGRVIGLVGQHTDITERKRAEDALMRVNQKLNVLSQLTRKDLDNQIFVLNSYLELAKHQLAGQDNIIETVQKGVRSIQSIHETIEYSKDYQDMGAKPPKWQNVNMALLFGLSHISIGNIQHSLETENLEIFADPLLEKVCQRLFENSVKHGDHVTRIRVWHTVTPEGATIFFEDNGIGIPQEKKEQIFLRSEGTRVSMRSLIFVREILDITGITIRETGEPGKGARFEMTVPKGAYRLGSVQ